MMKRKWRVTLLAEFMPRDANLLGININRSVIKIRCTCACVLCVCIVVVIREAHNNTFLPSLPLCSSAKSQQP